MKTGIVYKAVSISTAKVYIGITTYSLQHRIGRHLYASQNPKTKFHKAIKILGHSDFIWMILHQDIIEKELGNLEIKEIEKHNSYTNGFNSTCGGKSQFNHSQETKNKLSQINKGKKLTQETKDKIAIKAMGRKLSEHHKEKLIEGRRRKGNSKEHNQAISAAGKNRTVSQETRNKIGQASKGRKHSNTSKSKMSKARTGDKHCMAKLTNDDVVFIRNEYSKGNTSYAKLATKYNVNKSTIGRIIRKQGWKI